MKNENLSTQKAEAKLLQSSVKDMVSNLNQFFKAEKNKNLSLKEKNRHNI